MADFASVEVLLFELSLRALGALRTSSAYWRPSDLNGVFVGFGLNGVGPGGGRRGEPDFTHAS